MNQLFAFKIDQLDMISWSLVLLFFWISAMLFGGDVQNSLLGAVQIVGLMVLISHSIDIFLAVISNHPKAGELTGYVTNGPEALCVLVGLVHGKLLFAVGVPLGSNFANPILLIIAALLTANLMTLFKVSGWSTLRGLILTALLAGLFYAAELPMHYWIWILLTLAGTIYTYMNKGDEDIPDDTHEPAPAWMAIPAIIVLVAAGYALDPAVTYTAQESKVPVGVISFAVLSFLTSWPEFRSTTSLLRLNRVRSAVMNVIVSNITNLWLALGGTLTYLLIQRFGN